MLLLYPAANRDPAVFREPHRFDAARAPNDHVAFGIGAHFCLGANLARLELRVFFEELVRRMPSLASPTREPPPPAVELHLRHRAPAGRLARRATRAPPTCRMREDEEAAVEVPHTALQPATLGRW